MLLGMKDVVLLSNSNQVGSHAVDRDKLNLPYTCVKTYTEDLEDVLLDVFGAL